MHQTPRPVGGVLGRHVGVERRDETFAHVPVLGRDQVAVAVDVTGVERADQALVHRRLPVQPARAFQRPAAQQPTVDQADLRKRQRRLFDCGAADLVTHHRRSGVGEQQVEDAGVRVVGAVIAGCDGPVEIRSDVGVEPDLTFVEPHRQAGLTAAGVGRGDLEHHRRRTSAVLGIAQRDAVALAHLAGADPVDAERGDGALPEHRRQPLGGQVGGALDQLRTQR